MTRYNPSIDGTDALALNGFLAGTYIDGTASYAGLVDSSNCTALPWSPGRLTIDPAKPGGYLSCQYEIYVSDSLKYLENHPNLGWRQANAGSVAAATDIMKYKSGQYTVALGRVVLTNYVNFGRVRLLIIAIYAYNYNIFQIYTSIGAQNGFYGWNPVKNKTFYYISQAYEVLGCS